MNWLNETADRADHSELEFLADFIVLNKEEHIYTTFINGLNTLNILHNIGGARSLTFQGGGASLKLFEIGHLRPKLCKYREAVEKITLY